jgi:hypothetical protein
MIKDAIANIARNREVLHFLSCIARFLGHFSGLPTSRPCGLLDVDALVRSRFKDSPTKDLPEAMPNAGWLPFEGVGCPRQAPDEEAPELRSVG